MKNARKKNLVPFQGLTAYDQEITSGHSEEDIKYYGWELYQFFSKIVFTKLRKFFTTDGAHMQIS